MEENQVMDWKMAECCASPRWLVDAVAVVARVELNNNIKIKKQQQACTGQLKPLEY